MTMTQPENYLTSDDLAKLLHVSTKTIYNRLSMMKQSAANANLLPKPSTPPHMKGALWLPSVVAKWQQACNDPMPESRPKIGRPTKAEQVRKRMLQNVAHVSG